MACLCCLADPHFQFPCLGVYYWLLKPRGFVSLTRLPLSIPLSGSLLLARSPLIFYPEGDYDNFQFPCLGVYYWLTFPDGGILAMINSSFNSLVWESITGSHSLNLAHLVFIFSSFNSLVWESITGSDPSGLDIERHLRFQFPCLGVYYWLQGGRMIRMRVTN